jgi:hypothetical protein
MFPLSRVRQIGNFLTDYLELNSLPLLDAGVECVDISQTARINENNSFILKSDLRSPEVLGVILEGLPQIHEFKNNLCLVDDVLKKVVKSFELESYVSIGQNIPSHILNFLPKFSSSITTAPLLLIGDPPFDYDSLDPNLYLLDMNAFWVNGCIEQEMTSLETFFSISPQFKIEIALNRYQPLGGLANFSIGLVRLS